jgi:hypothetical protein
MVRQAKTATFAAYSYTHPRRLATAGSLGLLLTWAPAGVNVPGYVFTNFADLYAYYLNTIEGGSNENLPLTIFIDLVGADEIATIPLGPGNTAIQYNFGRNLTLLGQGAGANGTIGWGSFGGRYATLAYWPVAIKSIDFTSDHTVAVASGSNADALLLEDSSLIPVGETPPPLFTTSGDDSTYNITIERSQVGQTIASVYVPGIGINNLDTAFVNLGEGSVAGSNTHGTGISGTGVSWTITASSVQYDYSAVASELTTNALFEGYTPAVVGNWSGTSPANVATALDRIAAKIGPIA